LDQEVLEVQESGEVDMDVVLAGRVLGVADKSNILYYMFHLVHHKK